MGPSAMQNSVLRIRRVFGYLGILPKEAMSGLVGALVGYWFGKLPSKSS
jgi:hypothetical protein